MKLVRLLLHAFGPFTDAEIDFSGEGEKTATNFHLIYGPNEAGKSSALRAMTDLRFGINLRSTDDFLHASSQLRIAGIFTDSQGETIGLVRRKGRGSTLSRFDVDTGLPAASPEVAEEIARALQGGLERDEFEAMFGLNHERLRAGGERLLKGEGELGATLFEASAGTQNIAAIIAGLEADSKGLFNPHGRAQSAIINESRRNLEEQRQLWKQAQIRPAEWQSLNRAHEQAKAALAEIESDLETARRRENDLTELRTVAPLIHEYDRTRGELDDLAGVPDLPVSARDDRLAAEHALCRAKKDLQEAVIELTRCTESLDKLTIEEILLKHAEAIERLNSGVESVNRSRVEAQQQQAQNERTEGDLATVAARIAPGRTLSDVLLAVPSAGDRIALDQHLGEINRLSERLKGLQSRAEELAQHAINDSENLFPLPDPESRQKVVTTLQAAQALGDCSRQKNELEKEIRELDGGLTQMLSDLGIVSVEALRTARPLLDAQIANARNTLTDLDEFVRRAKEEDFRLENDLKQQEIRRRQLAAAGEIVTAETLRIAREKRDQGWDLIRKVYIEGSENGDDLSREFDTARPLPEAFEVAQNEADRQADLLRADATRAAGFEECAARIDEMEVRRRQIADELAKITARRNEWQAEWSRQLSESRLPDLDPEALREWQSLRQGALDVSGRISRLKVEHDRLLGEIAAAISALVKALQAVGQQPKGSSLPTLIQQAILWDKLTTSSEAEHSALAKAEKNRQVEREKLSSSIENTENEVQSHLASLRVWHARLFLPPGSTPETVKARLEELDALSRQSNTLTETRLRKAQLQAVVDDFAIQASKLALLLGEPAPDMADDFAGRLYTRLVLAREQNTQRLTLIRDHEKAQKRKKDAESEQATQSAILARLCATAGVDAIDLLPEREERATRKRLLQSQLTKQREQLMQASTRSEDELRERLAGQDLPAINAQRERCRAEILQLEERQAVARQAEEQTRRALEAIDSSDKAATAREAMESATARYRAALRPWARLKLAHALLQESLTRFRERAQAPMVAAASTYFSLMTGGRYTRLMADEAGDKPVLCAERKDGKRIGVQAMSEGTADQLYLALRLAALELRHASHPQMPLVLDDVLVTSDDHRAANILRALARFAQGGQVMLFTHHRHLIEVARSALEEQEIVFHCLKDHYNPFLQGDHPVSVV